MEFLKSLKKSLLRLLSGVAVEGRDMVAMVAVLAVLFTMFFGWWSLPLWLALAFVLQFFRDPERELPAGDLQKAALSPADGRVVFVGPATSPLDESPTLKISVFMNVFNVHVNRIPMDGKVIHTKHFPGAFLNAALDKASEKNERQVTALETAHGTVVCVQIAGLIARRISCDAREGDIVSAGTRYGFIRFGSRVDLHLPPEAVPAATLGDAAVGGRTILARFE